MDYNRFSSLYWYLTACSHGSHHCAALQQAPFFSHIKRNIYITQFHREFFCDSWQPLGLLDADECRQLCKIPLSPVTTSLQNFCSKSISTFSCFFWVLFNSLTNWSIILMFCRGMVNSLKGQLRQWRYQWYQHFMPQDDVLFWLFK